MIKPVATSTDIDSLRIAASWPNPSPQILLVLMNQLLAARRYDEAHEFFDKLSREHPDQALPLAIAGDPGRHAEVVRDLLDRDYLPVALRLADHALVRHTDHPALSALRQEVLERLVERNLSTGPFRFILYSGLSGIELPAPQL